MALLLLKGKGKPERRDARVPRMQGIWLDVGAVLGATRAIHPFDNLYAKRGGGGFFRATFESRAINARLFVLKMRPYGI